MAAILASEVPPIDQMLSLRALKKCFSEQLIISPMLWSAISGQEETVDRVVALSIKPLGYGEGRRAPFHKAMVQTIHIAIEIYSSQEAQSLQTIVDLITEDESAIKVIDRKATTGPFLKCLKKCIAIFAYTFGKGSVKNPHIDAYVSFHGYLDSILPNQEKEEYSYRLQGVARNHLETIFAKIEKIKFSGPSKDKAQLQKLLLEMACSKAPIENIIKLIDVVHEMTASSTMWLDFSNSKGLVSFLGRLLCCRREGRISIHMMTCPDYSGSLIDGVWHYDFLSLGTEEGFVASRAIGFVSEFARIAEKYISKVEIHHLLPTHEFIETAGKFGDHATKLKSSLGKIHSLYQREVHTHLSSEWLPDELFQKKKDEFVKAGIDDALALEVLHKRKALYDKFYPEATPADLLDRVKKQIAEYFIIGEMLTQSSHSLLLASDSTVMCKAYVLRGVPFLFGKVKGAAHYLGD